MKIIAKCYGVWGSHYYRTESGHTFSIDHGSIYETVCYYGNAITGEETIHILNNEEEKELFERVEFVN